jgi:hypothetical protein
MAAGRRSVRRAWAASSGSSCRCPYPEALRVTLCSSFLAPSNLFTPLTIWSLSCALSVRGSPFVRDERHRAHFRVELDALCCWLYRLDCSDVACIPEMFQVARGGLENKEIAGFGLYRVRDLVLAAYSRPAGVHSV